MFSSLSLSDVREYSREGPISSDVGIVNLHPSNETHWVGYIIQKCFDSYDCSSPQKLFTFFTERKPHSLYSNKKDKN